MSKKPGKKPIDYDCLDTWHEFGPKTLKVHPIPKNIDVKYAPNEEINSKIVLWTRGDSTRLNIDAIVNAANEDLEQGGGICGSIFKSA